MPVSTNEIENVFKVKLQHPRFRNRKVVFDVTPDLIENRNVNWRTLDPIHMPGQIYVYQNSLSRTFNISNARLISRTREEAEQNLRRLQILRAWTMPVFGAASLENVSPSQQIARQQRAGRTATVEDTAANEDIGSVSLDNELYGRDLFGAPPNVIHLSAYSATPTKETGANGTTALRLEHIRRVPCVVQQLSIPYPSDVDYIPSISGVPMPTIMTIDMTLVETHSPKEYEQFSIDKFRNGILDGF